MRRRRRRRRQRRRRHRRGRGQRGVDGDAGDVHRFARRVVHDDGRLERGLKHAALGGAELGRGDVGQDDARDEAHGAPVAPAAARVPVPVFEDGRHDEPEDGICVHEDEHLRDVETVEGPIRVCSPECQCAEEMKVSVCPLVGVHGR